MGKTFAKPLEILSSIVYNEANNKEEKAARERQLRKKEVSPMNNEELFEQDGLEEGVMEDVIEMTDEEGNTILFSIIDSSSCARCPLGSIPRTT